MFSFILSDYVGMEVMGLKVSVYSILLKGTKLIFKWFHHFAFPTTAYASWSCSVSLPTLFCQCFKL